MDRPFARKLSRSMKRTVKDGSSLDITGVARNTLPRLPFFKNDHDVLSSYKINDGNGLYYVVICNWRRTENYYLVLFGKFPGDGKFRILSELHNTDTNEVFWRYSPRKGDGRNDERRKRFITMYGSLQTRNIASQWRYIVG